MTSPEEVQKGHLQEPRGFPRNAQGWAAGWDTECYHGLHFTTTRLAIQSGVNRLPQRVILEVFFRNEHREAGDLGCAIHIDLPGPDPFHGSADRREVKCFGRDCGGWQAS